MCVQSGGEHRLAFAPHLAQPVADLFGFLCVSTVLEVAVSLTKRPA
jgi:hypothetical protein